jgi:predicted nucleic acid-binding protein
MEDNIQSAAAQEAQLDVIITRDQTGFKSSPLKVLTPTELLKMLPSL